MRRAQPEAPGAGDSRHPRGGGPCEATAHCTRRDGEARGDERTADRPAARAWARPVGVEHEISGEYSPSLGGADELDRGLNTRPKYVGVVSSASACSRSLERQRKTMEPTKILPIIVVVSLVTVEYGGWALLTFICGRGGLADWKKSFFRAGHAHAGVLLVLSLVYLLYLPRAEFSNALEWAGGGVLLAGVLAQAGGFFLHMAVGRPGEASAGTKLTRAGAALIAAALVTLAVGLIKTA